jgi:hypothetical protein
MKDNLSQIQGQLTYAYLNGGDKALWSIAKGKGLAAEKAREAIELSTSPFHNIGLYQAINVICQNV